MESTRRPGEEASRTRGGGGPTSRARRAKANPGPESRQRRGTAGGGNQLRQPYAKQMFGIDFHKEFPHAEHVHDFGLYIGNYPGLEYWKIEALCEGLNSL